jgi:hypothetical protein
MRRVAPRASRCGSRLDACALCHQGGPLGLQLGTLVGKGRAAGLHGIAMRVELPAVNFEHRLFGRDTLGR